MFGTCRALNGYNDNPTVEQFSAAYRKVLVQNTVFTSKHANCSPFRIASKPLSNILEISSRRRPIQNCENDNEPSSAEFEELHRVLTEIERMEKSSLTENLQHFTTAYIANVIENKIKNNMYCEGCAAVFDENPKTQNAFINSRSSEFPCIDTIKICKEADRYLKLRLLTGEINFSTIQYAIFQQIDIDTLYSNTNFSHDEDHKLYLVRSITDAFIQIKGSYIAKSSTLELYDKLVRSKFHKLIHFHGQ